MSLNALDSMTIEQYRCFYAEELRVVAEIDSPALVNAFARVPREQFLGPPPWRFHAGPSIKQPVYRTTKNVRDLYHDVFVALKPNHTLNNGAPSLLARLLVALNLTPGKRVLHIGCGTGYYSAIMVEAVGPKGSVTAIEVDPDLAVQATANLIGYDNVDVVCQDGATYKPSPCDAILVNAGVTSPAPSWVESLNDGGVLVLPLCIGRSEASRDTMVIKITRSSNHFAAELHSLLSLYRCTSLQDPALEALLNESLESRTIVRLKSVRMDVHEKTDSCIVHSAGFCLSAESAESVG